MPTRPPARPLAFRHRREQGVLQVTGADRLTWLNGLLTNDVLASGGDRYAAWLTPQGRMITDMFVVLERRIDAGWRSRRHWPQSLAQRLDGLIFAEDARVEDVSAGLLPLEVVGPAAGHGLDAREARPWPATVTSTSACGSSSSRLAALSSIVPRSMYDDAIAALTESGAVPIDDETAEILRVEAGVPRFLVDMNEETIPLEAGLDHAISHTKGCYVGQEIIVRIRDRAHGRVARHLVGLLLEGPAVPAADQPVLVDGRPVGRLTSAVRSVALGQPIALATLHRDHVSPGRPVTLSDGTVGTVAVLPLVAPASGP